MFKAIPSYWSALLIETFYLSTDLYKLFRPPPPKPQIKHYQAAEAVSKKNSFKKKFTNFKRKIETIS